MTTQTKFLLALAVSAAVAAWGAYEILASAFEPIIRTLGA